MYEKKNQINLKERKLLMFIFGYMISTDFFGHIHYEKNIKTYTELHT